MNTAFRIVEMPIIALALNVLATGCTSPPPIQPGTANTYVMYDGESKQSDEVAIINFAWPLQLKSELIKTSLMATVAERGINNQYPEGLSFAFNAGDHSILVFLYGIKARGSGTKSVMYPPTVLKVSLKKGGRYVLSSRYLVGGSEQSLSDKELWYQAKLDDTTRKGMVFDNKPILFKPMLIDVSSDKSLARVLLGKNIDWKIRYDCLVACNDRELLSRIAKQDANEYVRGGATKRIKRLK